MEIIKSTEDNINARCASCKYFAIGKFIHNTDSLDKKDKYCIVKDDNKSDFGICLNAKISSDYVNVWTERTPTQSTDGICATCDDERAYLQVGKDFCCIHYDGAKEYLSLQEAISYCIETYDNKESTRRILDFINSDREIHEQLCKHMLAPVRI